MTEKPKILLFDIETAPMKVYTFSLFKPVIGVNQIIERPRVLCWSAQWYGTKSVMFQSEYHDGYIEMLTGLRDLLDEAEVVVGYNSDSFDIPWMTEQFLENGIELPSPFKRVDLYRLNKRHLKTPSGKLDYLAWTLLNERKLSHSGIQLWIDCMDGDEATKAKGWALMKKYAIQDTKLLTPLYDKLKRFVTNVNMGLWSDSEMACPKCGSTDLQKRGFERTTAGKFQRYQCQSASCMAWSRGSKREDTTALRSIT